MPRHADHAERRSLIARTVQDQVAEHGLGSATFPRVAAAAGISVGLIQHYFTSKEALLRFVYEDALRARDDRLALVIAEGDAAERPIREILHRALLELLPLDETRRREAHVTQALLTTGLHDDGLAAVTAAADRGLHRRTATAMANGQQCGEVPAGTDPETAAGQILATTYGLATRLLLEPRGGGPAAATCEAVLTTLLRDLLPGECHHDGGTGGRG